MRIMGNDKKFFHNYKKDREDIIHMEQKEDYKKSIKTRLKKIRASSLIESIRIKKEIR